MGKMQNIFEIVGIERVKTNDIKPEFNIYHMKLLPLNMVKQEKSGHSMLEKMGLTDFKGWLDREYDDNEKAFMAEIPITKHTLDANNYKVGDHVVQEIYPYQTSLKEGDET